ncbi:hypothetical protein [Tardiphaga sp.]|uniref:hypothetical protein n=1 Tax=Tardiphaga sp. TaxID=1926292 RepID=UPI00352AA2FD
MKSAAFGVLAHSSSGSAWNNWHLTMQLEATVDAFVAEWLKNIPPANADRLWYSDVLKRTHPLGFSSRPFNWINSEGNQLLWSAARLLLQRTGEQRRVSVETSRQSIIDAHFSHLEKTRRTGIISEHAIVAGAIKRLSECTRFDGQYVFPICFAPSATTTRFRVGPALILSKAEFEREFLSAILAKAKDGEGFDQGAAMEWQSYSERYDHFLLVDINRHEMTMAWKAARDVAEYVLNLIRIRFGFHHMDDVRIGNGFVWETSQVTVIFDKNGGANLGLSRGPWGSVLRDDWVNQFDKSLGSASRMLASLAAWLASGDDARSPVLERLRYANSLIAETYSEPHDRIRLVRMVSALEALASLPRENKAESLAWRCAFAGGRTDCGTATQIVNDVRHAYEIRSAIVHGDPVEDHDVGQAFYRLERHLAGIYLGFLNLHAKVQRRYKPQHKRHIRQAFDRHIESFFWMPDEVW